MASSTFGVASSTFGVASSTFSERPMPPVRGVDRCAPIVDTIVRRSDDRQEEVLMERDVVCGMQVDPAKAAATSEYNGKTYYYCATACKTKFDANPSQYAK